MRTILAVILAAAIVTPVAAAQKTKSSDTVTIKKVHRSHNAYGAYGYVPTLPPQGYTQDVYVDGVYVGSDPDWRVRETLKSQYRHDRL